MNEQMRMIRNLEPDELRFRLVVLGVNGSGNDFLKTALPQFHNHSCMRRRVSVIVDIIQMLSGEATVFSAYYGTFYSIARY